MTGGASKGEEGRVCTGQSEKLPEWRASELKPDLEKGLSPAGLSWKTLGTQQ
jgi:hypothetical protein